MDLSTLSNVGKRNKRIKRVGRGNSSQRGKTSCRGHKGDKSRSGYKRRAGSSRSSFLSAARARVAGLSGPDRRMDRSTTTSVSTTSLPTAPSSRPSTATFQNAGTGSEKRSRAPRELRNSPSRRTEPSAPARAKHPATAKLRIPTNSNTTHSSLRFETGLSSMKPIVVPTPACSPSWAARPPTPDRKSPGTKLLNRGKN